MTKVGDSLPKDAVIKWTHSDCRHYVLTPNESGQDWVNLIQYPKGPGATWFAQAYIPTLWKLGELRVFIIGGQPIYTMHTKYHEGKSTWSWEPVDSFYSLQEFQWVDC